MELSLATIVLWAVPVVFAITLHEAAHGYVARIFGDQTAYMLGRVTLNPLRHIDPIGTVAVPGFLILLSSPFVFGWAKPVPVNFGNLRHPKRDTGAGVNVNLMLMALNLLPIPPLDGGRIAVSLLPHSLAAPYSRVEPYGFFVVIVLLATGLLNKMMLPLLSAGEYLIRALLSFV